jgi:iron complex transport system substrate-binding protein
MVRRCAPTVIITQEQCRICAVTTEDVHAACKDLPAKTVLLTIKPTTLEDVLGDVLAIASALRVPERGERLVASMRARLTSVEVAVKELTAIHSQRCVAHLEWLAPLMGSGYWIASLFEFAGAKMICGTAGGHSSVIGLSELNAADVIIIAPCGFSVERTHVELQICGLLEDEAWKSLPAVAAGRVYVADGNKHFNRSSTKVVETAEIVAEAVWEDCGLCGFFGHHGMWLVRLTELAEFCSRTGAEPVKKAVRVASDDRGTEQVKQAMGIAIDGNIACTPLSKLAQDSGEGRIAHVRQQVAAMRGGHWSQAFGMNSESNRSRLGSAQQFASMVQGHSSFSALANSDESSLSFSSQVATEVCVSLEGGLVFNFELSWQVDQWATNNVRLCC